MNGSTGEGERPSVSRRPTVRTTGTSAPTTRRLSQHVSFRPTHPPDVVPFCDNLVEKDAR